MHILATNEDQRGGSLTTTKSWRKFVKKFVLIAAAMVSAVSATEAFAGCSSGFLADLACQAGIIDQQTANAADQIHAGMGRPIETQVLPGIADAWYPGSGNVLRGWDQINRNGGFNGGGFNGGGFNGGGAPGQGWQQQAFGNFCQTFIGRAGPGQAAPVGSFCSDIYGNPGHVVR